MRGIAIVGGGPAGAHCARRLAESGFEVSLFEPRTRFEKPCGGGIPARAFDAFPFLADPRLPVRAVDRCLVIAPSGAETTFPLREPLRVFRRADLHEFLLDRAAAAGARTIPARVVSFEPAAGGDHTGRPGAGHRAARPANRWTIEAVNAAGARQTHGPYDFLIAADGAGGLARRKLAGGVPSAELTQAIGYYLPGPVEDAVVLKFCAGLNGYLWVFPRVDHDAAGICGILGAQPVSDLRRTLDGFLSGRYGDHRLAGAETYAALIPGAPPDRRGPRLRGEGWALVGDTGRSVDPLTREGIHFALESADLLAGALIAGQPETYPALWRRAMGLEFAWAGRHAGRFFDTRSIELLVALCSRSPRTTTIMSDLVAGRQRYRTLGLRLMLNGPAIAWQAMRPRWRSADQSRSWQLKH